MTYVNDQVVVLVAIETKKNYKTMLTEERRSHALTKGELASQRN